MLSAILAGPFGSRFWPTNQIPYVIDPSVQVPGNVVAAVNEFNDETNLQWIPWSNQPEYVIFDYGNIGLLGEAGNSQLGYFPFPGGQSITLEKAVPVYCRAP